jgi:hypothetical protein
MKNKKKKKNKKNKKKCNETLYIGFGTKKR